MTWEGVSVNEVMAAQKMGRTFARSWLASKFPQVTADELDRVVASFPELPEGGAVGNQTYDPHRRKFVALAWLCGASQAQLAQVFSVTRQTINAQLNRLLPGGNRQAMRLAQPPMEPAQLEGLKQNYYNLMAENPAALESYNLIDAARIVSAIPVVKDVDGAEEAAFGPAPDRKIAAEPEQPEPASQIDESMTRFDPLTHTKPADAFAQPFDWSKLQP